MSDVLRTYTENRPRSRLATVIGIGAPVLREALFIDNTSSKLGNYQDRLLDPLHAGEPAGRLARIMEAMRTASQRQAQQNGEEYRGQRAAPESDRLKSGFVVAGWTAHESFSVQDGRRF